MLQQSSLILSSHNVFISLKLFLLFSM